MALLENCIGRGLLADRPAAGAPGAVYFTSDTHEGFRDNGTDWDRITPAGIPILRGPYVVDFGDILHHGDSKVLWTPEVGDVLLRLFVDWQTVTQWATGQFLGIGQNVDVTVNPATNVIAYADSGTIGHGPGEGLDSILDAVGTDATDNAGAGWYSTAYVFNSAVPMRVMYGCLGGTTDATQGHVELYAVVARAVAP